MKEKDYCHNMFTGEIEEVVVPKKKKGKLGKYEAFRALNNYRKGTKEKCCGTCKISQRVGYNTKHYWKCQEMGFSHSTASDIRKSYVCDIWRPK